MLPGSHFATLSRSASGSASPVFFLFAPSTAPAESDMAPEGGAERGALPPSYCLKPFNNQDRRHAVTALDPPRRSPSALRIRAAPQGLCRFLPFALGWKERRSLDLRSFVHRPLKADSYPVGFFDGPLPEILGAAAAVETNHTLMTRPSAVDSFSISGKSRSTAPFPSVDTPPAKSTNRELGLFAEIVCSVELPLGLLYSLLFRQTPAREGMGYRRVQYTTNFLNDDRPKPQWTRNVVKE